MRHSLNALLNDLHQKLVLRLQLVVEILGHVVELVFVGLDFIALLLHSTIDVRLELATLHGFLPVVFIQGGLNLVALVLDRLLDGLGGTIHGAGKTTNSTLPFVIFTVIILLDRLPANEHLITEVLLMTPEDLFIFVDELKLHSDAVDGLILKDLVEAVTHDSNQHVQHRQLRDESRCEEKAVDQ